jgi:hypothetical protein
MTETIFKPSTEWLSHWNQIEKTGNCRWWGIDRLHVHGTRNQGRRAVARSVVALPRIFGKSHTTTSVLTTRDITHSRMAIAARHVSTRSAVG